ncbi:hypothetical protein C1H46_043619 [Malus baccata]|uniref:Uncharacterized protein n=1 Tax=Malus baccata TaxID=106549 RepID=A0A540K9C6_MALBA|nr:hypothetical protein C1H46_043619 [Malus baccata]
MTYRSMGSGYGGKWGGGQGKAGRGEGCCGWEKDERGGVGRQWVFCRREAVAAGKRTREAWCGWEDRQRVFCGGEDSK